MTNEWVESESCIARERNKLRALVEELVEALETLLNECDQHDHEYFDPTLAKARKVLNP